MQPSRYQWLPQANHVDPDAFLQLDPRKMPRTPDFGIGEEKPNEPPDPVKAPQPQGQPAGAGGGGGASPPPDSPMPDAIPAQGPGMHSHIGYMPPSRFSPGQEHGFSYPTPPPSITVPTMNSSFGGGGGGGDAGGPVGGSGGDNGGSYLPYFPGLGGGYDPGSGGGGSSRTKDYATSAGIQYSGGGGDEVGEGDWDDEAEEEMARGGMVASPRIVRLGERGPEAVMKLGVGEKPMRYLRRLS